MKNELVRSYQRCGKLGSKVEYRLHGELHRTGGPAIILSRDNGTLVFEQWYLNGHIHRDDGPAQRYYDESGKCFLQKYYWRGMPLEVKTDEAFQDYVSLQLIEDVQFA